ncbi:MAG: hypothetical protein M9958_00335 [Chitinophagales bacterium]|nr:hypothetical protein [Chitinophagales bacterium]
MTLKECFFKEISTIENLYKPVNWKEEFLNLLEGLEDITYEDIIADKDGDGFMFKLFFEVGKSYGKAKWCEALEAARTQMCEDSSTPPQFIP